MECNEQNLRFGQVVNTHSSLIIIEHINDEASEQELRDFARTTRGDSPQAPMGQQPPSQTIISQGCHIGPPYPERLCLRK